MDDKARVRAAADILEVAGAYTVLKRRGARGYEGLCPFHSERTPSFRVLTEEGIFRCFGCGAKGNVIDFVMQKEGMDFRQALQTLAERHGVTLSDATSEQFEGRQHLRDVIAAAAAYFRDIFQHPARGATARAYAAQRDLSGETIELFGIGAAPDDWNALHHHLLQAGHSAELQEAAGLVRLVPSGGYRDMFRNRLIFPICTELGTIIAFGGRAIVAGDQPKYLNSPDTALYQKGHQLFGLHLAKAEIRRKDRAILVEGYVDVVSLHGAGFGEAVGVLGTALTLQQARSLLRFTASKRVIIAFDADWAGQTAVARGIPVLEEVAKASGLSLSVLIVPDGKDPDAFIAAQGSEAFAALLDRAPGMVEFQIQHTLDHHADCQSPDGKAEAVRKLLPIFQRIGSQAQAEPYIRMVARRLGLNELNLLLDLTQHLRHNRALRYETRPAAVVQQRVAEAERGLIFLMVEYAEVRALMSERLAGIEFPDPAYQILRERLGADLAGMSEWDRLLTALEGTPEYEILQDIRFENFAGLAGEPLWAASDFVSVIASMHWEKEAMRLRTELAGTDLAKVEVQRITRELQDALVLAKGYQARLSGRVEPAATGS
ncbi:MAG: DNA primase [Cyanobacteria bacterium NC_groundwater_1444_Ag_S-0.65um_54_12]|nr:DNA primase [Cyanobacteria bacterium NC_groundwater_1444_Ag_S-0.65um_54_12]